ncbi:hypothetical protein [Roseisolibacter sp. H3M3-2]|uniref:hypothetical protein n=1 Tax=Roseisolibacter sp. H3M3-2 TaxID=3031323 RepID=UPI0023D9A169|nr:hypothetical protein [Roseisolibacter sp. H3M3-2]MDF1503464.1 hypothetical protein [Roseisolibacter sp. H3M3-2]
MSERPAVYTDWPSRRDVALTFGVVAGPLALLAALHARYALIGGWGCGSAAATAPSSAASAAGLLLCVAAALAARSQWPPAARGEDPGDGGGPEGRTRVLAVLGVGTSALSALTVVAMWLPQLILDPCRR